MKRKTIISALLSIVFILTGCASTSTTPPPTVAPTPTITAEPTEQPISELTVHFVDVGQADAAILQCEDDTMIIDGGNVADSSLIVAYLKKLNVPHIHKIRLIYLTHLNSTAQKFVFWCRQDTITM
ncbi:MAG: hypothetical protein HFE49_05465 [Clostridia bacterium]|nr:hypothetical protein [Clostridia bacterium]